MDSPRVDLKPLFAVVTLATGIGLVTVIDTISSWFSPTERKTSVQRAQSRDALPSPVVTLMPPPEQTLQRELSCYDPNILPIWQALKKDMEFKDRVGKSRDSANCSDMLNLHRVDVNGDGRKEIFVRGKNGQVCSAVGNCGFWIFEGTSSRPKLLLSASDYADISDLGDQVLRSHTNGYSDLLLKGHFSVSETGLYTYKFDGRKYVEARCMYEVPNYKTQRDDDGEIITCKEFEKWLRN